MRYKTKEECLDAAKILTSSKDLIEVNQKFSAYIQVKRNMFSPEELRLITLSDSSKIHISLEEWMDRIEEKLRYNLIIIFPISKKFIDLMKSVDIFFPDPYIGPTASVDGLKPATHGYIQWCSCPDSIHSFLITSTIKDVAFFDGDKIDAMRVMESLGLKPIVIEPEML